MDITKIINKKEMDSYKRVIHEAADESEIIIHKYFRKLPNFQTKADSSFVTIADKEAEKSIREIISNNFPDHSIIGEEQNDKLTKSKYKWIIDPIDGTLSFVTGIPLFTTMISLSFENEPILSLINQPINKERWVASKNGGCFFNNKKFSISKKNNLENSILATCSSNYFSEKNFNKFNNLKAKVKNSIYGGDAYLYMMLALNNIDIVVDCDLKPYDYIPLINIIEESGAVISNWEGAIPTGKANENIIACTSKDLHSQALKYLND